jgi:hypothetical protein
MFTLPNVAPLAESPVVEALIAVNCVAVVVASVVVPTTFKAPVIVAPVETERLVVEAFVKYAVPFEVRLVVDALNAKRLRNLRVEEPSEPPRSDPGVVLPAMTRRSVGVVVPRPMNPRAVTAKSDTPDDEATLNGSRAVDDEDCTLNAKAVDVPLIPATVPLSIKVDVPRVVAVSQRVA